jgi:hypothetical protein
LIEESFKNTVVEQTRTLSIAALHISRIYTLKRSRAEIGVQRGVRETKQGGRLGREALWAMDRGCDRSGRGLMRRIR